MLKTSGSGNDFYISIENYTTVQKTCDKFALLLYGNGNGSPICSLITVNVSGSNVQIDGPPAQSSQPAQPSGSADIDHAKAKSIALNHAGVSENEAYDMDIELDDEDGILVYEVEFKSGNMEYDYEINAATGAILKHESELDD